jgi:hypothetical protein
MAPRKEKKSKTKPKKPAVKTSIKKTSSKKGIKKKVIENTVVRPEYEIQGDCDEFPMITCTLAYLYNWYYFHVPEYAFLRKAVDSGKWDLYNSKPPDFRRMFERFEEKINLTRDDLVDYVKNGRNENVEKLIHFYCSDRKNGLYEQGLKQLVLDAIDKECDNRRKGYISFFHGQPSSFWLYNEITRHLAHIQVKNILNDKKLSSDEKTKLLNILYIRLNDGFKAKCLIEWDNVSKSAQQRALDMNLVYESGWDAIDSKGDIRKRLVSVNYSLFGNNNNADEDTMTYIADNHSSNIMGESFVKNLPFVSEHDYDNLKLKLTSSDLEKLTRLEKEFDKEKTVKYGILTIFAIPCNEIDNFVYNSRPHGKLIDGFISENNLASKLLKDYLTKDWGTHDKVNDEIFEKMDSTQARITDLCYENYGANKGIRIEYADLIPVDIKEKYINSISQLF